jgi:hypothetical protein
MNSRIQSAEYISHNQVRLVFKNGECRLFDFSPYLNYPVYQPLNNEDFSKQVKVEHGTICWENGIDFDPDRVYLESIELTK